MPVWRVHYEGKQMRWAPDAWMADPGDENACGSMLRSAHMRCWADGNRGMVSFLERHYPAAMDDPSGRLSGDVRTCRSRTHVLHHSGRSSDARLVAAVGCGKRPYCPACNNKAQRSRASNAVKIVRSLTPDGEPPRFLAVTVSPIRKTSEEPAKWREAVTQDSKRYAKVIYHEVIERMYGANVPAFGSFQPYGQDLFAYRHPHVHFTIGGWTLDDAEKPHEIEYYDMDEKGGLNAVRRPLAEGLSSEFGSDYGFHHEQFSVRIDYSNVIEPTRMLRKTDHWINYQYRELIDLTSMSYDRGSESITIRPYKEGAIPVRMSVMEWMAALARYAKEFGGWKGKGKPPFHQRYGLASDRLASKAAEVFGQTHGDSCICGACVTWTRPLPLADDERHRLDPMQFDWA